MLRIISFPIEIMKSIIGDDMELWSDTEKKLSTTWNGKPIYMKSFIVDGTISNYQQLTDTNDIKSIIGATGEHFWSGYNRYYLFPYTDSSYYLTICVQNDNLYLLTNLGFQDLKCTVWYTKTTD